MDQQTLDQKQQRYEALVKALEAKEKEISDLTESIIDLRKKIEAASAAEDEATLEKLEKELAKL